MDFPSSRKYYEVNSKIICSFSSSVCLIFSFDHAVLTMRSTYIMRLQKGKGSRIPMKLLHCLRNLMSHMVTSKFREWDPLVDWRSLKNIFRLVTSQLQRSF